jgi:hypothetical protein
MTKARDLANGGNATGYGAGGGRSSQRQTATAYTGGNCTPSVLYVLRF